MKMYILFGALAMVLVGCQTPSPYTGPDTNQLASWLEDKDVVEARYKGPHFYYNAMRRKFNRPQWREDRTFKVTVSENGQPKSLVRICFKDTPENRKRFLSIHSELIKCNYRPRTDHPIIWSYKADPALREKARKLLPKIRKDIDICLKAAIPGLKPKTTTIAKSKLNTNYMNYEFPPGSGWVGVDIFEVTPDKTWEYPSNMPDQRIFFPKLGLVFQIYCRPGHNCTKRAEVRQAALKALRSALKLLMDIDPKWKRLSSYQILGGVSKRSETPATP